MRVFTVSHKSAAVHCLTAQMFVPAGSQPGDRETLNVGGADDEEAVKNNGEVL